MVYYSYDGHWMEKRREEALLDIRQGHANDPKESPSSLLRNFVPLLLPKRREEKWAEGGMEHRRRRFRPLSILPSLRRWMALSGIRSRPRDRSGKSDRGERGRGGGNRERDWEKGQ